jgi:ubiquinone/menaquinone biosynthesis C-methylase UbiE
VPARILSRTPAPLADAAVRICDDDVVNTEPGFTWSDIAPWYDQLVSGGSGPHDTALGCTLGLVGDVGGLVVLDIACGQGLASRSLAAAGAAEVVGLHNSEAMLELARLHGGPPNLRYIRGDAQDLIGIDDESVDGVVCQLGLMDIPDLEAVLAAVHRVLRPHGWFVYVIGHPCFLAPEARTVQDAAGRRGRWISDYFTERFWRSSNPQGVRRAGNFHRTLASYINALIDCGFALERVEEPRASQLLEIQQPEYSAVPIFWAVRATKG